MREVSSDTNIWISLCKLGALQEAFQLDLEYLMEQSAAQDEILSPEYLLTQLRELGLSEVPLSEGEFRFAMERRAKYPALSTYDLFALAIAAKRNIPLLTGDGHLRKAGQLEGLEVHGLLWIIVLLRRQGVISQKRKDELLDAIGSSLGIYRLKREDVEKARSTN